MLARDILDQSQENSKSQERDREKASTCAAGSAEQVRQSFS